MSAVLVGLGAVAGLLLGIAAGARLARWRGRARQFARLAETEERLDKIIDAALDGYIVADTKGFILDVNPAYCRLVGYPREELVGTDIRGREAHLTPEQVDAKIAEMLAKGRDRFDTWHWRRDGTRVHLEVSIVVVRQQGEDVVVACVRDLTHRDEMEARLLRAQKLEAIGRMAGGVAHDFNNLLTAILGYADLVEATGTLDRTSRERLVRIRDAARQGGALTRQLLAIARQEIDEPRHVDVNRIVLETDSLLRRVLGEDIELVTVPAERPVVVRIDPTRLRQVLINLAVNARDAMPRGGTLSFRLEPVRLGERELPAGSELAPGPFVLLRVEDTGSGMTPDVLERAFEPFFTTKEVGKGTGLGLATCQAIVQDAGGFIRVSSAPGKGSVFKIYFPEAEAAPAEEPAAAAEEPLRVGAGTILVVEDQTLVRRVAAEVLRRRGYAVLEAATPVEALDVGRTARRIDLLLTDLVMPGMSGTRLAAEMKTARPDLRVLYMSGYALDPAVREDVRDGQLPFLAKPFTPDELVRAVQRVLDG